MNILAIDTSTYVLGIAILKNNQIIGEFSTNLPKNHSVRLMPAIDQLMHDVKMTPDELDKIIVAKGPGSYTGVRIGLTTAKTLAWALNIPIVGVSSLEALAYQGRFFNSYVNPFFDARRETVFTGLYKWKQDKFIQVIEETNILMKDWLNLIKKYNEEILFLSPNIDIFSQMIIDEMDQLAIIPEKVYQVTKPSHLAIAGLTQSSDHTHTLVPNYLRLAEAEANWIKAQEKGNS